MSNLSIQEVINKMEAKQGSIGINMNKLKWQNLV